MLTGDDGVHASQATNREASFFAAKRFLGVLAVSCAGLAALVMVLYVQDCRYERSITEQEGAHLVGLQTAIVTQEFEDVRADLLFLSDQQLLRQFLSGLDEAKGILEQNYAALCVRKGIYDQVRCLDTSGREIIRVNYDGAAHVVPESRLQEKAERYYYRQALDLKAGEVLVSPFDLNVEHGVVERPLKPTIRFLTPVLDQSGVKQGFLVLNYQGNHLLARIIHASRRARGASFLLNSRSDYLLAEHPGDAWGWMLGHEHTFRADYPGAWDRIRKSDEGQFFTEEGLFTFHRLDHAARPDGMLTGAEESPAEGEAFDPSLILVSRVPAPAVYARSSKLLAQLFLVWAVASIVVAGVAWREAKAAGLRRAHEAQIAESELRLRKLSAQLLAAQEEERRSISRQLHDELGQLATAVNLDLKSAARQSDSHHSADLLRRAIGGTEQLLKSMHAIATRVRPTVLDDLGLRDAVQSFLEEFSQRTGIVVSVELRFEREHVPAEASEHAYRILQEALTNVAKHAQTDRASVAIHVDAKKIELSVRDEGCGFESEFQGAGRLGLLGMQERAELMGGTWRLTSAPGQGTRIDVSIPCLPAGS